MRFMIHIDSLGNMRRVLTAKDVAPWLGPVTLVFLDCTCKKGFWYQRGKCISLWDVPQVICHAILATRKSAVRSLLDSWKGTAFPWHLFLDHVSLFLMKAILTWWNMLVCLLKVSGLSHLIKNLQKPMVSFRFPSRKHIKDSVSFDTAIAASPLWHASMSLGIQLLMRVMWGTHTIHVYLPTFGCF